jgi:hypothetical protein
VETTPNHNARAFENKSFKSQPISKSEAACEAVPVSKALRVMPICAFLLTNPVR